MNRTNILLLLASCMLVSPLFAASATDWLNKGKELLNTTTIEKDNSTLSDLDISNGLKQALEKGAETVVAQLSSVDGFNGDQNIHIPLPDNFKKMNKILKRLGYASWTEDLELKLNRAAELATPKAKTLFVDAIKNMQLNDVNNIYHGEDDAATQYFKSKMSAPLAEAFKPIIDDSLDEVGAIQLYDKMLKKYQSMPFVPNLKADLSQHVNDQAMSGIFYYLAKEEAAIRKDPLKQSTELLKKLFSN